MIDETQRKAKLQRIELLLLDVDGVMTEGGVSWNNQGVEQKTFHIRDGLGIRLFSQSGKRVGIVTGRASHVVQLRASELGIGIVRQGVEEKLNSVSSILTETGLSFEQTAFIGDDLPDLAVLKRCGVGVAVADAVKEVLDAATIVTAARGGKGAVREVVEMILRAQGRWDAIVQRFESGVS